MAFLSLRIELIAGAALVCVLVFEFGSVAFEVSKKFFGKMKRYKND